MFNADGVRFNLLVACLSEIVLNALKYIDSESKKPIRIEWKKQDGQSHFICQNTFNLTKKPKSSTEKGLAFIKGLTDMIEDIEFSYSSENTVFTVQLQFKNLS